MKLTQPDFITEVLIKFYVVFSHFMVLTFLLNQLSHYTFGTLTKALSIYNTIISLLLYSNVFVLFETQGNILPRATDGFLNFCCYSRIFKSPKMHLLKHDTAAFAKRDLHVHCLTIWIPFLFGNNSTKDRNHCPSIAIINRFAFLQFITS